MAEALELSDEQSAQLLPILQDAESEKRALHEQALEQINPDICNLMEDTNSRILDVLTPEQAMQFEEMKQGLKDRHQQRRGGRGLADLDCEAADA